RDLGLSEQAKRLRCGAQVVRDGAASVAVPVRERRMTAAARARAAVARPPLGSPDLLDVAILGQVALGYSPFIDRNRTVAATRLSVYPLRPDANLDVAQLLHAVGDVWPASGGNVSLNVVSESLVHDLLQASPTANLMVEVPNFIASDPASTGDLVRLHGNGNTLLLKGRPNAPLPREV